MIVADASVVTVVLADDGSLGGRARSRLRGEQVIAPDVLDLEVLAALRKMLMNGDLDQARANLAVQDLRRLPCTRVRHLPLLDRVWALRGNVRPYDAAYVALAEARDAALLTGDARLAGATGPRCRFEVLS